MGKNKNKSGGNTTKIKKTSSGRGRMTRAKRELQRILMKIARWKLNQNDPKKVSPKWDKKQKVRLRPRHNEWNTDGLERRAKQLLEIIDMGIKVRV